MDPTVEQILKLSKEISNYLLLVDFVRFLPTVDVCILPLYCHAHC